jgi:hypothetical protein
MNMQIIIAIACLGLLMWVEPANAQRRPQPQIPFELTVGAHKKAMLGANEVEIGNRVDEILKRASKVLRKCNVVLKRKGPVGTVSAPNDAGLIGINFFHPNDPTAVRQAARERDAVHREDFDIKVVATPFFFCLGPPPDEKEIADGCAFDPLPNEEVPQRRSMIVGNKRSDLKFTATVWAHEFGHKRGLSHRNEAKALMNCKVERENSRINDHECKCIREGPGVCNEPPTRCPSDDDFR